MLLGRTKKRKRKFTLKSKHPRRIEQQFKNKLQRQIAFISREINSRLMPLLKKRNDSVEDEILLVMDRITQIINEMVNNPDDIADAVELNKVDELAKTIGVDLFAQTAVTDYSEIKRVWVANAQRLITKMNTEYIDRVMGIVNRGFSDGVRHEVLAKQIRESTGVSMRKAALIARNEIGNINSQITIKRNQELGIKEYIWRTARGERVRGNPSGLYPKASPSHYDREGKTYSYKKGAGARDRHPGNGINCRCFTESIIIFD